MRNEGLLSTSYRRVGIRYRYDYELSAKLTVGREGRKLLGRTSQFKVFGPSSGWERSGSADGALGNGYDIRAVNEVLTIVSQGSELGHSGAKALRHELLLIDETLPEACSAFISSEDEVGL